MSDYNEDIKESAHCIIQEAEDYDDDLSDSIHETADNAVIYHSSIIEIISESRNLNAIEDVGLMDNLGSADTVGNVLGRIAYWAYHADLTQAVNAISDEERLEIRDEFKCEDCDSVESQGDAHEFDDMTLCFDCYEERMEEYEEEEEEDEEADGNSGQIEAYLIAEYPAPGPHERDTLNGMVYRVLFVEDGVPSMGFSGSVTKDLAERIPDDKRPNPEHARWSWGNNGIIGRNAHAAAEFARLCFDLHPRITFKEIL